MAKNQRKSRKALDNSQQREIVLSPLFELKDPRYKVRHASMTEEETNELARNWVRLCLDAYEKEHGPLPPPPSEEKFHRIWKEVFGKTGQP
ncbi:MAG: hypothetical protein Q7S29_02010 [Candidatus Peribacter sp.]|nr:hypothetical protein [Candidatus Peribacter sp.]